MGYLTVLRPGDVNDARSFASFCQQRLGTPPPRGRQIAVLQRNVNSFFADNPRASWTTLCRVVDWCRAKKRRPATSWGVVACWKWAWSDGAIPEMDPTEMADPNVEWNIAWALERETDDYWRRALAGSCGLENRREVLRSWRERRLSAT